MTMSVSSLQYQNQPTMTGEQRNKDKAEGVALGVGATGIVTNQARQHVTKSYLQQMCTSASRASKMTRQNVAEVTSLWGKFGKDIQKFSKDIMARAMKFKNNRFLGPIVKSPIMKGSAHVFGVTMAFFALVTGINKAVDNGKLMIGDLKNKLDLAA